jgi:hypothetical protein
MKLIFFSILWIIFCLLGSGSGYGSTDLIESGSETLIYNTVPDILINIGVSARVAPQVDKLVLVPHYDTWSINLTNITHSLTFHYFKCKKIFPFLHMMGVMFVFLKLPRLSP